MSNWLSEIEEKNSKLGAIWGNEGIEEIKRMARVIRELVEYIELTRSGVSFFQIDHAFKNLSPDAKEVINDSKAQSST